MRKNSHEWIQKITVTGINEEHNNKPNHSLKNHISDSNKHISYIDVNRNAVWKLEDENISTSTNRYNYHNNPTSHISKLVSNIIISSAKTTQQYSHAQNAKSHRELIKSCDNERNLTSDTTQCNNTVLRDNEQSLYSEHNNNNPQVITMFLNHIGIVVAVQNKNLDTEGIYEKTGTNFFKIDNEAYYAIYALKFENVQGSNIIGIIEQCAEYLIAKHHYIAHEDMIHKHYISTFKFNKIDAYRFDKISNFVNHKGYLPFLIVASNTIHTKPHGYSNLITIADYVSENVNVESDEFTIRDSKSIVSDFGKKFGHKLPKSIIESRIPRNDPPPERGLTGALLTIEELSKSKGLYALADDVINDSKTNKTTLNGYLFGQVQYEIHSNLMASLISIAVKHDTHHVIEDILSYVSAGDAHKRLGRLTQVDVLDIINDLLCRRVEAPFWLFCEIEGLRWLLEDNAWH